jgi:transcription elongation factor Elf1
MTAEGRLHTTNLYCPICGTQGLLDCGRSIMERSEILDCLKCGMRVTIPVEQFDGIQTKSVQLRT